MDGNRYGAAYARTLQGLRDRDKIIEPQLDLRPGELFNDTSPVYQSRLNEMQERIDRFLAQAHASPLYDLESRGERERDALDDAVILYAMGGVDDRGVEACARIYLRACKRPQAVERGERNPPPAPGTVGGKIQPGIAKQISRPPKLPPSLEIERIDRRGARLQELTPDFWRYAVLLRDEEAQDIYFRSAPLQEGTYGYAKLNPQSLITHPEKPELWAVQFYCPSNQYSYYFKYTQNNIEAHAPADYQDEIDKAWGRGFQPKK